MKPNNVRVVSRTGWTWKVICAACLMMSSLSACATQTSAYGPVLLSDSDRACLSRQAKEAIEANNETWLKENE
jgi:hypothetical protein